jgi:diaminopropionate ammonia-lyase
MLILNRHPGHGAPLEARDADLVGGEATLAAARFFARQPGYRPTPLFRLPALAATLGIGVIEVKDEGQRLGLGSFKALGGAYAVARLTQEAASLALGRPIGADQLTEPQVRAVAAGLTFACATDGNHGRSVAFGAQLVGARSVVFLHAGVSEARATAIRSYGAQVVRTPGAYDDSVALAAQAAAAQGWTLVSDTAWPGYEHIPGLVMQGYTLIAGEALQAMARPPTHLFVQAGVGGLAAALAGRMRLSLGAQRPILVVVEPDRAACLHASAAAGRLQAIDPGEPTIMAMLECYRPSIVAWRILARAADAFMTVGEDEAVAAMRRLAKPAAGDPAVVAGESGAAGLAGLVHAAGDPAMRAAIGLDASARVLLINTEGATDPALYRQLVGVEPEKALGSPMPAVTQ